jgi:lipopolysaccharide assembly outer membrane protein LptD (OstA)
VLASSYIASSQLLREFDRNVQSEEFHPQARSLEISQVDSNSHRSWHVRAQTGKGDEEFQHVLAQDVQAFIYDEDKAELRVQVRSPRAVIDRENSKDWRVVLKGRSQVEMLAQDLTMDADTFHLVKDEPLLAKGNVEIRLQDGSLLKAAEALIDKSFRRLVLKDMEPSELGENLRVSGGEVILNMRDGTPETVLVKDGTEVETDGNRCQAKRMVVQMDATGKPQVADFTGNPVATQADGNTIHARKIRFLIPQGELQAMGGVNARLSG